MKTDLMLRKFGKKFPKRIAKANHDFVGLMLGKMPKEVHKVLVCLDCDWQLLPLVKVYKPDLIISHHPFFFGSKAKIMKYDESKRLLANELSALGVTVYSMHTNFDSGKGGMNDALAEALSLENVYAPEEDIMMRIGDLPCPMNVVDFANYAKEKFQIDYALLVNNGEETIKKVGIIGGGGSRSWRIAQKHDADIYISGDAPHYVRRDIVNSGYNYLDMPHEIEKIFIPVITKMLLDMDPSLKVFPVNHEELPKVI